MPFSTYTAHDRLDPYASPGQRRVRELAVRAPTPAALRETLQDHRAVLGVDRLLARPDALTVCERAYIGWQHRRGTPDQHEGPLQGQYAAYVVERVGRDIEGSLAALLAPAGTGALTGVRTLHALFHQGFDPTRSSPSDPPRGALYPDEGIVVCEGGHHRVAAHVVAGVLLTPQLGGSWAVWRTQADHELLDVLRMITELNGHQMPPLPDRGSDTQELRRRVCALRPALEELAHRGLRLPTSSPSWPPRERADVAVTRLEEQVRLILDGDRRAVARRPRLA
jgi:hypothetical protein